MPVAAGARAAATTSGQRRAVLRDGLRRRHVVRDRARRPRRRSTPDGARQRQRVARRHDGRDPRRRPRRRRARRPRQPRGLHRPPAEALVRPVEPAEDARAARRRRGARRAARRASPSRVRRRSSTATTGSTTAWSATTATSVAVLDWEICTLGDPLADVGLLQVYWTGPATTPSRVGGDVHHRAGLLDRAELAERYAEVVGPRPVRARLLRRVRVLEAGLHPRGRVRPLPRRRARRRATRPSSSRSSEQVDGAAVAGRRAPGAACA